MSSAHTILQDVFGYSDFRGPQQALVALREDKTVAKLYNQFELLPNTSRTGVDNEMDKATSD